MEVQVGSIVAPAAPRGRFNLRVKELINKVPPFLAFGPKENGECELINFDQIREIRATDHEHCTVFFSATHTAQLTGGAASDLLDAVTRLILNPKDFRSSEPNDDCDAPERRTQRSSEGLRVLRA